MVYRNGFINRCYLCVAVKTFNKAIKNRRKRRGWTRKQRSPFIAALAFMEVFLNLFWVIFLAWLIPGLGLAVFLIQASKWKLLFGGVALMLYGALSAIDMIQRGKSLNLPEFEYAGHLLLLLYSVLGSSLVGGALSEIRKSNSGADG